jgi:hypothetical protein
MRVRAVVDRFEGDKAVLLLGEEERAAAWPRSALPAGAREGDVLWVELSIDAAATRAAKEEAEALLRQLLDRNK